VVQAQLGHASATVTLDRYGHLFPDELQQLADRLQHAYAGAVANPARTRRPRPHLGKAKEQVSDLLLLVEVGRLPCLVIRTPPPHAAAMAESGR
jgi:hypothetical protein